MDRFWLTLPAMFADHHVVSVRQALAALDGVTDIRCSAATRRVDLSFDPTRQSPESIEAALAGLGYRSDAAVPSYPDATPTPARHTAAPAGTTAFHHEPPAWQGRPLWPCPGFQPTPVPDE